VEHALNFEALAIVNSMLIENINMQMEGEVADLLDRRMMSLFGVDTQHIDKVDVQNTTHKLKKVKAKFGGRSQSVNPTGIEAQKSLANSKTLQGGLPNSPANYNIGINKQQNDSMFSNLGESLTELPPEENKHSNAINETANAREMLKKTGSLPISIDNNCLMSMQPGRDTQMVLRLFKTACLSYQASDVKYREHKLSRN
jgi:hypothetical protein